MDDAERQRTMDFILRQQAQFTAGMQKLEEADTRASLRLDRLERTLVLMAQQFRRERRDLRGRVAALVTAQMRTEEAVRSLTVTTERNRKDIGTPSGEAEGKAGDAGDGGDSPS